MAIVARPCGYLLFFVGVLLFGCFAENLDDATKEFIKCVIENHDATIGILTGPLRAVPHGQHTRTRLGYSCRAFLVPDVILWDPMAYFPHRVIFCPTCDEQEVKEDLHPIRWIDGSKTYEQPRLLYGLRNDVLLVSRVYLCKNKHQIISHDSGILSQVKEDFPPPFVLFHHAGVTTELFQFVIAHVRAGMTIADVQALWHQSLFDEYGLRKLCFVKERQDDCEDFLSFTPKGRKVGEKVIIACYVQEYLMNEHLYGKRMCQMKASSLSADHTFKVSANIGFWCKGKWIQLYDSLFIVMNEIGIVVSWKLCKGTAFHEVQDPLQRLKGRLDDLGCSIDYFFVDNCCQWRSKLNSIFDSSAVKLDPFHAIQRITSKIPKKGAKGSPIRRLRSQLVTGLKLVIRDPTDQGEKRTKPTPSKDVIKTSIANFLKQWKDVEFDGTKLMPQCAVDEINKLLIHVEKGCLSDIPPSGGTSRNEGIHRVLNKTLKKSRIGIQFAIALLGMFFLYLE